MLDVIRSGLEKLYAERKQRKFAWALVQFYLYCKMNKLAELYNLIKMQARAYTDHLTLMEYAMLYGREEFRRKFGFDVWAIDEIKTTMGKAKALLFIDDARFRSSVKKEILTEQNMKTAGLALLYYVAATNTGNEWANKLRNEIIEKTNDKMLLWKLTGEMKHLNNNFGILIEPWTWFVWKK